MNGNTRNKNLSGDIDIGLAVMEALSDNDTALTQVDIAEVCGCSQGMIYLIEVEAKKKASQRLKKIYRELDLDFML